MKFAAIAEFVKPQTFQTFDLPFYKIETIIGAKLPESAKRPQYWANTEAASNPVRAALKDSNYDTFLVEGSKRVQFRRRF